ncbi:Crp/Fnr family transcriptional regulator [Dyadobacter frigoris]|uniref:Crp/Fnr family transcriptional regulator n=1 Tax=Dyadobacter frigoris TaxID=2576211 RepID=A0A4U6CVC5_9BACT|nr:Crp/Fnr family transcriptional regulator [Dyadobacter frigoris]TKT88612.1 Crp/Fnr family transcriptional regulator [Dyadobacter frigoris]GLU54945.1 hypothetical protein Dfri01_44060 [Dyadobacter frigoris]
MIEFIRTNYPSIELDDNISSDLASRTLTHRVAGRHRFLQPHHIQQSIFFIRTGVIRSYSLKRGLEFTDWIFSTGDIMLDTMSFFLEKEAGLFLETTSSSVVFEIQKKDFQYLYEKYSIFKEIIDHSLFELDKRKKEHTHDLSVLTGFERYQKFMTFQAHLDGNIQGNHLAPYLGVTADHLTKIKKLFSS